MIINFFFFKENCYFQQRPKAFFEEQFFYFSGVKPGGPGDVLSGTFLKDQGRVALAPVFPNL